MNLNPGDTIFAAIGIYPPIVTKCVAWRHATYFVVGHYWPTVRLVLTPENEGIEWIKPKSDAELDAFRTAVALSHSR